MSGGMKMSDKNGQSKRKSATKGQHTGQPSPMSGSHKVKNQNHSRQKNHSHHDM